MNCQMFSITLSSGHFGGSGTNVMFGGTATLADMCQPARSSSSTACAPGATAAEISRRCRFIAPMLRWGKTRPAALPSSGQTAPKMEVDAVRWSCGAGGRSGAALRPAAGDLVLLPHAGLVGEPDLYRGGLDPLLACDLLQLGGEDLSKSAIAPSAWAWWRGRADSFR